MFSLYFFLFFPPLSLFCVSFVVPDISNECSPSFFPHDFTWSFYQVSPLLDPFFFILDIFPHTLFLFVFSPFTPFPPPARFKSSMFWAGLFCPSYFFLSNPHRFSCSLVRFSFLRFLEHRPCASSFLSCFRSTMSSLPNRGPAVLLLARPPFRFLNTSDTLLLFFSPPSISFTRLT